MRRLVISIALLLMLPMVAHGQGYNIPFSPRAGGNPPLPTASVRLDADSENARGDCGATSCIGDLMGTTSGDNWTIEMQVNCDDVTDTWRGLLNGDDTGGVNEWGFYATEQTNGNAAMASTGNGSWSTYTGDEWCDDTWQHVAVVFDGASSLLSATLYVDGVDLGLGASWGESGTMGATDEWVLGGSSATDHPIAWITDVRVWSTSRTQTQIQQHDKCQIACADGDTSCPAGLEVYWPMNDKSAGSNVTITEVSGGQGSVDLTLDNTAFWADSVAPSFVNDGSNDCYDDGS